MHRGAGHEEDHVALDGGDVARAFQRGGEVGDRHRQVRPGVGRRRGRRRQQAVTAARAASAGSTGAVAGHERSPSLLPQKQTCNTFQICCRQGSIGLR